MITANSAVVIFTSNIAHNAGRGWEVPGVIVGHLGEVFDGVDEEDGIPLEDRFPTELFWAETVEEVTDHL